jgi:hypothetical protein
MKTKIARFAFLVIIKLEIDYQILENTPITTL